MNAEILHQVPFSTGRERPTIHVPYGACDCHHHIYDPINFPYDKDDTRNQPPSTVEAYRLLQKRLGTTRNVIIQASAYGTDNSCLLDALRVMGTTNSRGIAVTDINITKQELDTMDILGVRGLRINMASELSANKIEDIMPLAYKAHERGWHMQFWLTADQIVELEPLLNDIPCPVVFDHRAHLPQPQGIEHVAFKVVCRLLDKGHGWVKLSGLDHDSKLGEPTYADTVAVGAAFAQYAPERMVWGTDWPHPGKYSGLKKSPNDAQTFDLLAKQVPDERIRHLILVDNPVKLYGFEPV